MHSGIRIGVIGDYNEKSNAHRAISQALTASSDNVQPVWVATDSISDGDLAGFDGVWCAPGMPYRSADGVLLAIRHARVSRKPFLGTSAGFQYAVLEYARGVLGLSGADHQKTHPQSAMPLIAPLDSALAGVRARVRLMHGTKLQRAYGTADTLEEYHCSYGINDRYRRLLNGGDLLVAATNDHDDIRAVELDGHPFFVATLFQPELRALGAESSGNPLVKAFVDACAGRAGGRIATRGA